jgi:gluconolactonase
MSIIRALVFAAVAAGTAASAIQAQAPATPPGGTPFRVDKLDPAIDALIPAGAQLDTLGDRFALTEGPLWMPDASIPAPAGGYLLFSDNAANVIYRWERGKPLSVFLERSGYTGKDVTTVGAQTVMGRTPILLIGSNGLARDPQGRVVVTGMNDRTVYRVEKDGTRTVLADRYDGKRFNGPNDITIKSNGAIYFTDTPFGMRGGAKDPSREMPYNGFYLIKDGKVTLLGGDHDAHGGMPNGITLSPDEKYLYVAAAGRGTMRYEVQPDDTIANGRLFVNYGIDGMRTDERGNLFTTSGGNPGVIQVTSPDGTPLGRLHLPQPDYEPRPRVCATNVEFGDADRRTLFIMSCTHVFSLRVTVPGAKRF